MDLPEVPRLWIFNHRNLRKVIEIHFPIRIPIACQKQRCFFSEPILGQVLFSVLGASREIHAQEPVSKPNLRGQVMDGMWNTSPAKGQHIQTNLSTECYIDIYYRTYFFSPSRNLMINLVDNDIFAAICHYITLIFKFVIRVNKQGISECHYNI